MRGGRFGSRGYIDLVSEVCDLVWEVLDLVWEVVGLPRRLSLSLEIEFWKKKVSGGIRD